MLMMLGTIVDGQGAKQLMLTMLGDFVAWARSRAADADDARCVGGIVKEQNSRGLLMLVGASQ